MNQKYTRTAAAGLFAAAVALGVLPACTKAPASDGPVSGEFTGTAQGLGGDVTVKLTLDNGVITAVTAEGPGETEGIGTKALEQLPEKMVAGNTVTVDSISGATITSEAVVEAAKAALAEAGLTPEDLVPAETSAGVAEDVTVDADVVIIGAGGAGMTAAIVAADAGKTVVVVESQDVSGGNSVRSTGGMNAGKTPYQDTNEFGETAGMEKVFASAEKYADNADITALAATVKSQWEAYQAAPEGYFDSVELFELDTMIGGKGLNDFALVQTLAENSADAIEWLSGIGADLKNVAAFGGASVKRIHRPVNDEGKVISVGAYVVPILENTMNSKGVTTYFNTTAEEIVMNDGKAAGIVAVKDDGSKVTVNAPAVIITAGGFGANNNMVVEQNPILDGYCTTNAAGIQGQGISMAAAIGASTVDMDQIQLHPTVHVEDGKASLITEGLRGDGAILVNQEGLRFFDEVGTRDAVSNAENEQTGGYAWLIVDQAMADASAVIQGYITKGFAVQGETYEDLAAAVEMDSAAFAETMAKWNACVEAGKDEEFGRTSFAKKLDAAPYYAIKVQPGIHHTMGGLEINSNTEVISTAGAPIPGVFAAGEVTGGVHGANRLGGNAVADFIVFGRIAGKAAAEYAK